MWMKIWKMRDYIIGQLEYSCAYGGRQNLTAIENMQSLVAQISRWSLNSSGPRWCWGWIRCRLLSRSLTSFSLVARPFVRIHFYIVVEPNQIFFLCSTNISELSQTKQGRTCSLPSIIHCVSCGLVDTVLCQAQAWTWIVGSPIMTGVNRGSRNNANFIHLSHQ